MRPALFALLLWLIGLAFPTAVSADTGYDLWLGYRPVSGQRAADLRAHARAVVVGRGSPTLDAAREELLRGLRGTLGTAPEPTNMAGVDGAILIGTPASLPAIAALRLPLAGLSDEGFAIRSVSLGGHRMTAIAANTDIGVLYGVYAWLARMRTGAPLDDIDLTSVPKLKLRMLDHWDNIDGTAGRGYAGASIWDWWTLPEWRKQRYVDYARANASIGINGTVLNNVNASAEMLTHRYLVKTAALADVFRPYGIKLYLSARFSAPIEIGGLKTADPLDPAVRAWWAAKARETYALIPDFGGFLIKANSEGQPGPQDYHRSHAEGANMLAAALKPYGGIVMWRAFVYSNSDSVDRTKEAYAEFKPLDGRFADNVVVQVKNGPVDFQPREPFSPLFGAMPKTPVMMEFQVTKEYLGFATHLVYLGALFHEVLSADTFAHGPGSTVGRVLEGQGALSGLAGVANVGTDLDWTGGVFNQANWYALGRMAWDPQADPRQVASDWAALTFTPDPAFVEPVVAMMMRSREAVVDYMTPLGLAHQMVTGHHYGPAPWLDRATYYSHADTGGIGFDRTATGSDAIAQYQPAARAHVLKDDRYLLWFHHLPWKHRMPSGATLWDTLVERYDNGVAAVAQMQRDWASLESYVDEQRFTQVAAFLAVQHREALWWRNASISYFRSVAKLPLPAGHAPPPHDLSYYQSIAFDHVPGDD